MDKKKIIVSAITIGATGALLIGATFAFFSDTSTSSGNKFTSGVLDLQVKDDDEGFQNNVTASTVSPTNWAPGESFESYICFKNVGTIDIEEIILKMTASGGNSAFRDAVIAEKVELGPVSDDSKCENFASGGSMTDFTTIFELRFDDVDANSTVSLTELLADVLGDDRVEDDLLNGPNPAYLPVGAIVKFRTTWRFDPAATSAAAGQTVTVKTTFTANQDEVL